MRFVTAALAAVLVALPAVAPTTARAQSACVAGSLASYVALGSTGCTVNGVLFTGFGTSASTTYVGGLTLTPSARTEGSGTVVGFLLGYDALTASRTFPAGTSAIANVNTVAEVTVRATVGAGRVGSGERLSEFAGTATTTGTYGLDVPEVYAFGYFSATPIGGSSLQLGYAVSTLCAGQPAACPTDAARALGPATTFDLVFGGQAGFFANGRSTATFATSTTFASTLTGYRAGLLVTQAAVVPEPSTLALTVGGLAALAATARRRRA